MIGEMIGERSTDRILIDRNANDPNYFLRWMIDQKYYYHFRLNDKTGLEYEIVFWPNLQIIFVLSFHCESTFFDFRLYSHDLNFEFEKIQKWDFIATLIFFQLFDLG